MTPSLLTDTKVLRIGNATATRATLGDSSHSLEMANGCEHFDWRTPAIYYEPSK